MREKLTTAAELVGMGLVVAGVAMWALPAALIVAGVCLVTIGVAEGRA